MRDITFRGKRIDNSEWVYGDLLTLNKNGEFCPRIRPSTNLSDFPVQVAPSTVGQYMGLKDKDGNKIFEGDIIALNPRRFANKRVFYYTRCCGFYLTGSMDEPKPCDINPIFSDDCLKYEVIGNIHDNPELMKGGEK